MATAAASSSVECVRRLRFCCVLTTLWLIAFDWLMCATTAAAAVAAKLRIRPHSRWRRRRPLGPNFKTNRKWQFLLFLDMDLITRLSLHIFTSLFLPSNSPAPHTPFTLAFTGISVDRNTTQFVIFNLLNYHKMQATQFIFMLGRLSRTAVVPQIVAPSLSLLHSLSLSAWINLLCEGDEGGSTERRAHDLRATVPTAKDCSKILCCIFFFLSCKR